MRDNVFRPVQQVRDKQPIRATCFHPSGETYVVGTNSKTLKICKYPDREQLEDFTGEDGPDDGIISEPEILFTCLHIHRASVYCAAFNAAGNLLATGSNDQIVHIINYDSQTHAPKGSEYKLSLHSGTVRDVCFLPTDNNSTSSNLLSAGGREFEVVMTDCVVMKPKQIFEGHDDTVMSIHCCTEAENMFVSGSLDGTIKIWDIRCKNPVAQASNKCEVSLPSVAENGRNISYESNNSRNAPPPGNHQQGDLENLPPADKGKAGFGQDQSTTSMSQANSRKGIPVGVVRLDPTGRLLVSGHQDGSCQLYDIRADCIIQSFKAHDGEIRALNFSPKSHYLLTGGYDCKVRLTDLQGELNCPLPSVDIIELDDKIVQTAWHPVDHNFVTTCADGSATLWTIADFDEWRRDSFIYMDSY